MRLKTATDACQKTLIRGGFEASIRHLWRLWLGEKKSGEAYEVWLSPDGYRSDWFVRIHKGSLVTLASKDHRGFIEWDSSNPITLIFV